MQSAAPIERRRDGATGARATRLARWLVRAGIVVAVLLPLVPLLIWSLSFRWYFPDPLPSAWSGRAWAYVFSPTSRVLPALGYSGVVGTAVTLLSLLIGLPAGRALGLHQFRGKTAVHFLILAPTIIPPIAVAMGVHVAFIGYGLADTLPGVILVHLIPVLPYVVLILSGVFANYNPDYEAQARVLGASRPQVLRRVTLPTIKPGLIVAALFAFIISWSQYLLTLLIGGGRVITLPLLLFSFANSGDYPITAALSLVFIAPALIFLAFTSRYLGGEEAAMGGFGRL
jgi:putative spermidine/putrescine transport system permease protein